MTKPITILYVDDYPLDRELVRDVLEKDDGGFRVIEAASRTEFEARLAAGGYDLVLSDFNILGFEGLQVIDAVQAEKGPLPVVILTGTGSEEVAVEAMKRGAADYVLKSPQHIQRLPLTLRAVLERVWTEEALKNTAMRLNDAQRLAHIGSWELDLTNNMLTWSDEIFRMFEIDPEKFDASYEAFLDAIHPDDREAVNFAYTNSLETRTPYTIDHRLLFSEGRIKYVHEQCETFYDGDKPIRSIGTVQDVTERKQAEESLHRLNRELRAISNCNQTLLRAEDEQTLLNDICRIVCDEAGYRMAWVGYAEQDEARTVRPVAWAGVEDGYLATTNITWADTERGHGPAGTAIRTGESACIQDFTTDPEAAPWRENALQRGYRSSIALPLKNENAHTFSALCIYSAEPNVFTPDEARLLEELAGDLAFGVTTLRVRAEHKKAEMQILASEQLFRALVENSPDFIARYDREFRRVYVNPAIQKLFGMPVEDVFNKTPADQSPVYAPQVYIDQLRQVIESATERTIEMPFRTAQGEMHWGHMRFVPEFGSAGQVASVLAIGRDIHEIKENERRFRMLAENFPDFVVRFDRDCRYTYINPAVEKVFGMKAEAFIGKTLHESPLSYQPEQNDALLVLIRRAFDEGVANDSEVSWDTQMGKRIFEIRHVPEKDAAGNIVTVLSIAHDITERKRAEQERLAHLRFMESMDRINRVMHGTNDLEQMMSDVLNVVLSVFECDRAALVYPCDPEATSWRVPMERVRPELTGVLTMRSEMPMDVDVARSFQIMRAANGPVKFGPESEYPLPAAVSQRFGLQSLIGMALYPKVDRPWEFVLHQCSYPRVWTVEEERLFQEIGRRLGDALTGLLTYQKLQQSEERLRLTLEAAQIGIWDWDIQHDLWYASPIYHTMLGYAPKEGFGERGEWLERLHPDDQDMVSAKIQRVLARDFQEYRYEARMRHADGAYRWVSVVGFNIQRDEDGQVNRMLGIRMDITDRKRAEEEIRQLNQELEQRVLNRTAQLEAANKELEAFAYSVSHDLRSPLRHIDGFIEMLQEKTKTTLDDQARHYMEVIAESARKMGTLIDDLLSFSRMGRHEMSQSQVDLNELVQDVIRESKPETKDRDIQWQISPLPLVTGDRAMLRIVLSNLILNALKFTRQREPARIEIGYEKENETEVIIFVRDNGTGFDMHYADKLFGVFQRLHHAEEFEGTGIGLANVRRIVNRHGGKVWAKGEIDQGATFYFSLPY